MNTVFRYLIIILSIPAVVMAENSSLQHMFIEHTPSLQEITRPGYTPVKVQPLRAQQITWNKHSYVVLLYRVSLKEKEFQGLESYLLNPKTNTKIKITGHKTRSKNLDVPVLRVADINKDGVDELVYIYSFDLLNNMIMQGLVFKEEIEEDKLVQLNMLSLALEESNAFNRLSGSVGDQPAPVEVDKINAAIDAFIAEQ